MTKPPLSAADIQAIRKLLANRPTEPNPSTLADLDKLDALVILRGRK